MRIIFHQIFTYFIQDSFLYSSCIAKSCFDFLNLLKKAILEIISYFLTKSCKIGTQLSMAPIHHTLPSFSYQKLSSFPDQLALIRRNSSSCVSFNHGSLKIPPFFPRKTECVFSGPGAHFPCLWFCMKHVSLLLYYTINTEERSFCACDKAISSSVSWHRRPAISRTS